MSTAQRKYSPAGRTAISQQASFGEACKQIASIIRRRAKSFGGICFVALFLWAALWVALPKTYLARAWMVIPAQDSAQDDPDAPELAVSANPLHVNLANLALTLVKTPAMIDAMVMACNEGSSFWMQETHDCGSLSQNADEARDRLVADVQILDAPGAVEITYRAPSRKLALSIVEMLAKEMAANVARAGAADNKPARKISRTGQTAVVEGDDKSATMDAPTPASPAPSRSPDAARANAVPTNRPVPYVSRLEASYLPDTPRPVPFVAAGVAFAVVAACALIALAESRIRKLVASVFSPEERPDEEAFLEPPSMKARPVARRPDSWRSNPRQTKPLRREYAAMKETKVEETEFEETETQADTIRRRKIFLIAVERPDCGQSARQIQRLIQALTASGARVLVADCDFEAPCADRILGVPLTPGLGDVTARRLHPGEAVHATTTPGLLVLPAGLSDDRDADIFRGAGFYELMRWARRFDHVLALCPPSSRSRAMTDLLRLHGAGLVMALDQGARREPEKPRRQGRKARRHSA